MTQNSLSIFDDVAEALFEVVVELGVVLVRASGLGVLFFDDELLFIVSRTFIDSWDPGA